MPDVVLLLDRILRFNFGLLPLLEIRMHVVRVAWCLTVSNSPMPDPGNVSFPSALIIQNVRLSLASELRKIEDAIDRIDPPGNPDHLDASMLPYFSTQLDVIQKSTQQACALVAFLAIFRQSEEADDVIPPADAERILDELDDVILPCEGGGE